jgi:hypothetical protein
MSITVADSLFGALNRVSDPSKISGESNFKEGCSFTPEQEKLFAGIRDAFSSTYVSIGRSPKTTSSMEL